MTDLLAELLLDLGRLAWDPFWMPITAWTLLAACALAVMAFVPAREVFLRRDLHFALLLALPAGLVASKLLGGIPGANLLRTWWQGPALVAPVSPPEMTLSPVFEPDPAGIVSIGAPVLEPSIDPAVWIGLGTLLAALVASVALVLLLVAVVRLRRLLSGATPDGALRLANGHEVRILRSDRVQVPFSCGVFRPMIVLPDGPLQDRDVIVAHEAAHHEHRDVARLWSVGLVHAAFAFHPLVHLLSSRLTWLMEAACDRATLERTGLPASRYSEVLLRAVPQSAPRALRVALPMGRSVEELRSRIVALGHTANPALRGRAVSVGSMGVFAASMLLVAAAGIAATEAPALGKVDVTTMVGDLESATASELPDGQSRLDGSESSADRAKSGAVPRDAVEKRQGIVRGRVTRADNREPLPGASVMVDGTSMGSVTGPDGGYSISGVSAGRHALRVSFVGFMTMVQSDVVVPEGGTVTVHFALNQQVYELEEVRVPPPPPLQPSVPSRPGEPVRSTNPADPETYVIVEQMPELIGGLDELRGRVVYPDLARRAGIEGGVIVQFVVDTDGKVVDPVVVRGIGSGCDEEALRVVRTATFKPGMQRGLPVRVKMSLPIIFDLDGEDAPPPPPPPQPREPGVTEPGRPVNPPGQPVQLDSAGNPVEVFVIVEKMPELIGGLDGLQSSMVYPELAAKAGVQGRVIVQFIVMPDGSVFDARVVRGIGAGCDEEALRVVRAARFNPGRQRDVAVPVKMSLPITFKLAEDRGEPAAPSLRDEPFTGEIEVFTDASDVGRPFYVQVYGGPVEAYGSLAEKERMAIEVGRQNRCNAVLIGTVDRGPWMGRYADENPGLRDLRPGQWVGIRYLRQTPEN